VDCGVRASPEGEKKPSATRAEDVALSSTSCSVRTPSRGSPSAAVAGGVSCHGRQRSSGGPYRRNGFTVVGLPDWHELASEATSECRTAEKPADPPGDAMRAPTHWWSAIRHSPEPPCRPRHAKSAECEARAEATGGGILDAYRAYGDRHGTSGIRRPRPLGTRVVPALRDGDRGRGVVCHGRAHHPALRVLDHPGPGPAGPSRSDGPASQNAVNRHSQARGSGSIPRRPRRTVGRPMTRQLTRPTS
jgi:hypothetical protein